MGQDGGAWGVLALPRYHSTSPSLLILPSAPCGCLGMWDRVLDTSQFGDEEGKGKIKKGRNTKELFGKEKLPCPKVLLSSACRCLDPQVGLWERR